MSEPGDKFRPRVYTGRGPIDIAAEYIDHPRVAEWRDYARNMRYPDDFAAWLTRIEAAEATARDSERAQLQALMDRQGVRSPSRIVRWLRRKDGRGGIRDHADKAKPMGDLDLLWQPGRVHK